MTDRTVHLLVPLVLSGCLAAAASLLPEGFPATAARSHVAEPADAELAHEVRFGWIDVVIDTGAQPLGAYQVDLRATAGDVRIVGIEGRQALARAGYPDPPAYDPRAMQHDRVILAAFADPARRQGAQGDAPLPRGRVVVATVHVRIGGPVEPQYEATLVAAGDAAGERLDAELILEPGVTP
jgi:hypothetical protein